MTGSQRKDAGRSAEDDRSQAPRQSAGDDVDAREEEGWDQPQSSAQRPPHREDDQDDVQ